jgi:hypothetical protein
MDVVGGFNVGNGCIFALPCLLRIANMQIDDSLIPKSGYIIE